MTREEALQIIWDRCQHSKETEEALEVLKEERPHGEWIVSMSSTRCSKCGYNGKTVETTNFCPNCGASMSANYRQVTGKLEWKVIMNDVCDYKP